MDANIVGGTQQQSKTTLFVLDIVQYIVQNISDYMTIDILYIVEILGKLLDPILKEIVLNEILVIFR